MPDFPHSLRLPAASLVLILLGGCVSWSPDGGFGAIEKDVRKRLEKDVVRSKSSAEEPRVARRIAELLSQPLSVDAAVQIALLNNQSLQASYAELGITEADLVQAGRVRNPVLSFSRLRRGGELEIDRQLTMPVLGLLTMPIQVAIGRARFEQAQLRATQDVLRVADATRQAYFAALFAQQSATYFEQVTEVAAASADLAERMVAAGNWSKVRQSREQAFHADALAQLSRSRQNLVIERERLTRLLGVSGAQTTFRLPDRLPDLPAAPRAIDDAEAQAMSNRVDVILANRELIALQQTLGLVRTTRFVNVLDVGYEHNTSNEQPRQTGFDVELELPLFDWGDAKVARAEAIYVQAMARASERAINARSEVREAYANYRHAFDLAVHYRDRVVPLKKRISDEQLLRYNAMLASVFELLADARAQVASVNAAMEAQRDFWIADSRLEMSLTGSPTSMPSARAAVSDESNTGRGH